MEKKRRTFSAEFKAQAVQLAKDLKSFSEASRQLGVSDSVIRLWTKSAKNVAAVQRQDPNFSIEEMRRLKAENEKLKKVNQILKSAAAFFSQDHLK